MSRPNGYAWLLQRWDSLRGSFWFFPAQMAILSGAIALGMLELDRQLPVGWGTSLPWLTRVDVEGARAVLSTIAGSMITVTGVVFSITVVALTLTSSQFGPRLLRTFFRDRGSQVALGTFLATFCYSLLVLQAVGSAERVPQLATAGAVGLAIASLFVLIFFVHHAASSIQASNVIAAVADEIRAQVPTLFPETLGDAKPREPNPEERVRIQRLDVAGRVIRARGEGYVRVIDETAILGPASERDLVVRLLVRPGDFVAQASGIACVDATSDLDPVVEDELRSAFVLGDQRTPVQDLRFLTDQLSEMAVRALSPGVNDPKTAIECLDRMGGLLAQLADRAMPSGLRYDEGGMLRLVVEPTRFDEIAASCFDSVRCHGAEDPQVVVAVFAALRAGLVEGIEPARIPVLETHAREMHAAFRRSRSSASERDRAAVDAAFEGLLGELDRAAGGIERAAC
ncbi:MAG: DUF2254 domain-containing protein [Myxococcales bacterium]|nr:DUF2254 domain-containing protein [Myxococcales bacterium]